MKNKLFFTLCVFSILKFSAQLPQFTWLSSAGSASADQGHGVKTDAMGNVYTTGQFQGTVDFDPGPGTSTLTSFGGNDVFVSKFNSAGTLQWVVKMGGTSGEIGRALALDSNGDIVVTGNFQGTVDFDPGVGTFTLTAVNSDAFIVKLNNAGNFVWAKQISANGPEIGYGIAIDNSSNILSIGTFTGIVDFDPGIGTSTLQSSGGTDIYISKLDAAGNFAWAKKVGGSGFDEGFALACDGTGNVFCTGYFNATSDFDPGVGTFTLTSSGSTDAFVLKLDVLGNFIWALKQGGASADYSYGICVDPLGNVINTGSYGTTVDFDPGPGVSNLTSVGNNDIFISKYSSAGLLVWTKSMGGSNYEYGQSVASDLSGNIFAAGNFAGTVDFDSGPGSYTLTSAGLDDAFSVKLDASGTFVWAIKVGSSGTDWIRSVTVSNMGAVLLTGYYSATVDFDPSIGTFTSTSSGAEDIFILNLCNLPSSPINVTPAQNLTLCALASATLSANGGGTLSWYSSPTSTNVIANGSVISTSTLAMGNYSFYVGSITCAENTLRTIVSITVQPSPSLTVISSGSICEGSSATLSVTGADTYSWSAGGSTFSISVTPSITSIYSVVGTFSNTGCSSTATLSQVVMNCNSISEMELNSKIKIYPNPVTNYLTFDLMYKTEIAIYDLTGKQIVCKEFPIGKTTLNIEEFSKGVYLIKGRSEKFSVAKKLIKE